MKQDKKLSIQADGHCHNTLRAVLALALLLASLPIASPVLMAADQPPPQSSPAGSSPISTFGGGTTSGGGAGGSWDASPAAASPPPAPVAAGQAKPPPAAGASASKPQPKPPAGPTYEQLISDPNKLSQEISRLSPKPATPAGAPGSAAPEMDNNKYQALTPEQKREALIKARNAQVEQAAQQAISTYTEGKANLAATHQRLMDTASTYKLDSNDKLLQKILADFRHAAEKEEARILRESITSNKPYAQLSPAEKALFNNNHEAFTSAQKAFAAARARAVQNSASMFDDSGRIIQSYQVKSWQELTPKEQAYFGDSESEFRQAQARYAQQAKMSDPEIAYLTARQAWANEQAVLSQLKNQRIREKDPAKRTGVENQIAAQQEKVDRAYEQYTGLQRDALAAAYTRRSEDLKKEIEQLDAELSATEPGPKRREIEARIAAKMSDQRQNEYKAREIMDKLTFAERLNQFVTGYSEYSGLGQYAALFISDKDLAKRRKEAEDAFCNTILLGGTNCWSSKICQSNIDATIGGTGIVASGAAGEPRGAVRIQADKGQPAIFTNETTNEATQRFLYHVEYFIQNTNEEPLRYNLLFIPHQGTPFTAFAQDKELAAGATESRIRTNAIVKYSGRDYTTVCLTLKPGIKRFNGGLAKEVCTKITVYQGGPTRMAGAPSSTGQGTQMPSAGSRQDFEGF